MSPLYGVGAGDLARVIVLCLISGTIANASELLWYSGDADSQGILNNTRLTASFGDNVLDDFIVSGEWAWQVTGLFSNNVAADPIETAPITQAVWSVRTGAAPGDFGQILFSGISSAIVTPTGRRVGGDVEYTIMVSGFSFDLPAGIYFMSVSPIARAQNYYVGVSNGTNAVGVAGPGEVLREEHFIENGAPADHIYGSGASLVSMGVTGNLNTPEANTASLFAIALSLALLRRLPAASIRSRFT